MNKLSQKYPEHKDFVEKAAIVIKLALGKVTLLVLGAIIFAQVMGLIVNVLASLYLSPILQDVAQRQQEARLERQQQEQREQLEALRADQAEEEDSEEESDEE